MIFRFLIQWLNQTIFLKHKNSLYFASEIKVLQSVVDSKLEVNKHVLQNISLGKFDWHGTTESYFDMVRPVFTGIE